MLTLVRRRARLILTVVIAAASLLLGFAVPAHAGGSWWIADGFETSPESTWWFESSGGDSGDFGGFDGIPHAGSRYATIFRGGPGWASVARTVHLSPASTHPSSCSAQVWLQEAPGTRVNFEVIDPSTWTYVALKPIVLPSDVLWHSYSTAAWTPGPVVDVVIRVSVISDGRFETVKVDDLLVACNYS